MSWINIYNKIKIPLVILLGVVLILTFLFYPKESLVYCDTGDTIITQKYNSNYLELCVEVPGSILLTSRSNLSTLTITSNSIFGD